MKLKGKIALITGGSSGIGKAIALKFQKEGAKVIIFDIDKPRFKADFFKVDISNEEEISDAFKSIKKLDILVNNAGIYFQSSIEKTKFTDLKKIIDINVKGTFLVTKHAFLSLKKAKEALLIYLPD